MGGSKYKQSSTRKRTKKSKTSFKGNRYTKLKKIDDDDDGHDISIPEPLNDNVNEETMNVPEEEPAETGDVLSSSAAKIDMSFYDTDRSINTPIIDDDQQGPSGLCSNGENPETLVGEGENPVDMNCMYILSDVKIMLDLFNLVGRCLHCSADIEVSVDFSAKKGLAHKLIFKCTTCDWTMYKYTSTTIKPNVHTQSRHDVNIRSIVAFREIGRGLAHIETYSRIMNMPPPFSHSTYDTTVGEILQPYVNAMNNSMQKAAKNVLEHNMNKEAEDMLSSDCDVSLDGSWQRRGYASLNGFVSAIEMVTDKVVDVDVITKYCHSCIYWSSRGDDPGYEDWAMNHNCPINHEGSSGSMETEGAVRIFKRSIEKNNLCYMNYIGDGDSSAFKRVHDSDPYPGRTVQKLECVGHVQKRVGAGLLNLTKTHKGISGKGDGKLTRKVINTLQNYFGMAIRDNKNTNLLKMKMAIAAVLHHCTQKEKDGEDKEDRHKYCPKDAETWCKYQQSKVEDTEFKGDRVNTCLPVYDLIRPLWLKWSNDDLLNKCLHGQTQNVNEAFNQIVWKRAPKDVFVGKNIFQMAVASAVVSFNDGASGIIKIMQEIGLTIGYFNMESSRNTDLKRISAIAHKATDKRKSQRKKLHAKKKGYSVSDKDYGAGMH